MNKAITVSVLVKGDINKIWRSFITPADIQEWLHASDDWSCPHAENNLTVGGQFLSRMAAKDGSVSFDLIGTYTAVEEHKLIAYTLEDGRTVEVIFTETEDGVEVTETFEMEHENSEEMQRGGWQAILDNFKKHVEQV
ncbi:MAG: polyketide cyclase [Candidatus Nomurabacteria bacterium]|nr:polyketide cyclase [Candidatus Nomurabacteria bacterium]